MQVHGFSVRTHYLAAVTDRARYFHRSAEQLRIEGLRVYFEHLVTERSLSEGSRGLRLSERVSVKVRDIDGEG